MDIPTFAEIAQHFATQYQENDFMQAAVIAAPVTALTYAARNLPKQLWKTAQRLFSIEISFNSDIPSYDDIADLITKEIINDMFSLRYNFDAKETWDRHQDAAVVESRGLQAGYGRHWGMFRGTMVIVNRFLEEGNQTASFKERMEITFLTRRRKVVREFAKMLSEEIGRGGAEDAVNVFLNRCDYWNRNSKLPLRRMET